RPTGAARSGHPFPDLGPVTFRADQLSLNRRDQRSRKDGEALDGVSEPVSPGGDGHGAAADRGASSDDAWRFPWAAAFRVRRPGASNHPTATIVIGGLRVLAPGGIPSGPDAAGFVHGFQALFRVPALPPAMSGPSEDRGGNGSIPSRT